MRSFYEISKVINPGPFYAGPNLTAALYIPALIPPDKKKMPLRLEGQGCTPKSQISVNFDFLKNIKLRNDVLVLYKQKARLPNNLFQNIIR